MTFAESVDFYLYLNNKNDYMEDFTVNAEVDKAQLLDYLLYEYADMLTIDSDVNTFHDHVKNFFDIHKWNIDKLADSLKYYYNPIGNVNYREVTDYDRTQAVDTTENRDTTTDFTDTENIGVKRDENINFDDTFHRQTDTITTDVFHEDDSDQSEDINYVSAFNDGSDDSKHHRDTHEGSATKDSTDNKNVNEIEDSTDKQKTVEDETTKTDRNETTKTVRDDDFVGHEGLGEAQDTIHDKYGHDSTHTFQELIEQERAQAQFNLYKWIAKHFAHELLIAIW